MVTPRSNIKRHGSHQKKTRNFLKVYWPYMPLLIFVGLSLWFSGYWQQRTNHGVLAYATSVSVSSLLQSTNDQRTANGVAALSLNSKLDQAAQAKANDMVARDYWSHNTPDGNPSWVFIDQAGYSYKLAGENLAYGFMTSSDTIAGWMNSPSHRENLLNKSYIEVGFGFANSANYQNSGPETVVVAMYGTPLTVAAAPTNPPPSTKVIVPQTKASTDTQASPQPTPVKEPTKKDQPVTNQTSKQSEPSTKKISRLEALTRGSAPWIMSVVSILGIASIAALIIKNGVVLHKVLLRGERYLMHNVLFDITLISFIGLCIIVSRTAGFIR